MKKICSCIVVVAILMTLTGCTSSKYNKAVELYEAGNYEDALEAFSEINDYEDSADYIENCQNEITYQAAVDYLEQENYQDAIDLLDEIIEFKNSSELRRQANFGLLYVYLNNTSYQKTADIEGREFTFGISGSSPTKLQFSGEYQSVSQSQYTSVSSDVKYSCSLTVDAKGEVNVKYEENGTMSSDYMGETPIQGSATKGPFDAGSLRATQKIISTETSSEDGMINGLTAIILYYMGDLLNDIPLGITPADLGFTSL